MPYIKQHFRELLLKMTVQELMDAALRLDAGDLNFVISSILWAKWKKSPCYSNGNTIIGVLECAKLEFVRRHLNDYENQKLAESGDLS